MESTFGRVVGEVILDGEFAPKDAAFVGRPHGAFDLCLYVHDVGLIGYHLHAYLDRSTPTVRALLHALRHLPRDRERHLRVHRNV